MKDIIDSATERIARYGTYMVRYACQNCGASFSIGICRGVEARDNEQCPKCGCFSTMKRWPGEHRA